MFGPFDGNGYEEGCSQVGQPYSTGTYTSNVSQTNFLSSLLTDFVTETDYSYQSHYNSYGFESQTTTQTAQTFDSSEASTPPPTPDIISTFATFAAESPLSTSTTTTVDTTPTYQNLCSPVYPIQSPTSSCSSMSMASPSFTYDDTRKQLIKDSLRLTIQSRRVAQGLDQIDANDMSSNTNTESDTTSPDITLSEADNERRRRRRERNKVAATKCRNKKKLHSIKLHQESESLQVNNAQMRKEIEDLRRECQQLMSLLSSHESICKQTNKFANNYTNYFQNYDQNNNNLIHCNTNEIRSNSYTNNSYYINTNNSNNTMNLNSIL